MGCTGISYRDWKGRVNKGPKETCWYDIHAYNPDGGKVSGAYTDTNSTPEAAFWSKHKLLEASLASLIRKHEIQNTPKSKRF